MNFFDSLNSWKEISPSLPKQGEIYRRRILADSLYDHFIGIDDEGRYMYMLKLPDAPESDFEQPSINGCHATLERLSCDWHFCLRLKDSREWAIFKLACQVLIRTLEEHFSQNTQNTLQQVSRILKKCTLFFKKQSSCLTKSSASGLIGELLFLKNYIVPKVGWACSLNCWKGPTGAPQDFAVADTVIEIKTTESADTNKVTISNAEQLAPCNTQGFLFVQALSSGISQSEDAITLCSLVREIEAEMYNATGDTSLLLVYLTQLGYTADAEEAHRPYQILGETFYALKDNFPRITPEMLPIGISSIKYTIDLNVCKKYITLPDWITHE